MKKNIKKCILCAILLVALIAGMASEFIVYNQIAYADRLPVKVEMIQDDTQGDAVTVSVVKWELEDIPNSDSRPTTKDMKGFIATTLEVAKRWAPTNCPANQMAFLFYDIGADYYATITYIGSNYISDGVSYDDISCNEFRALIEEQGIALYYTGVKDSGGTGGGETSQITKVAKPVIVPTGEGKNGVVLVRLYCETEGATIYYTLDGSAPNENSTVYAPGSVVSVPENGTIRAFAMKAGLENSGIVAENFSNNTSGNPGGKVGPGSSEQKGDTMNTNQTTNANHGFCVGWVAFIFSMLLLLYTALYVIMWLPQTDNLVTKLKLDAIKNLQEKIMLFGFVNLLLLIGIAVSCAIWIFAFVVLLVHSCPITVVAFILATLILGFFGFATWCEFTKKNPKKQVNSSENED